MDENWRLVATIIDEDTYFADSTNSIHVTDDSDYDLRYILALLNSRLFQWRFKLTSTNNNVGTNEIKILPFRLIDFENTEEKESYEKIIDMVDRLIKVNEELTTARMDKRRNFYKRLQTNLEMQIDEHVYTLYGISTESQKGLIELASR